jgi:hypothetical protein
MIVAIQPCRSSFLPIIILSQKILSVIIMVHLIF